jgi:hypothetical protein
MLPNKGIFSFFLGALLGGIGCSDISFKLGTQMKGILGQMSKNRGKREERREEREERREKTRREKTRGEKSEERREKMGREKTGREKRENGKTYFYK